MKVTQGMEVREEAACGACIKNQSRCSVEYYDITMQF